MAVMPSQCLRLACGVLAIATAVSSFGCSSIKHQRPTLTLQNAKKPSSTPTKPLGRKEGVYVRPSGAIERGSGFYIPGLEGGKVRLVFGSVLIAMIAVNHVLSNVTNTNLEIISISYAILVLLQGIVQWKREQWDTKDTSNEGLDRSKTISYEQTWFVPIPNIEWKQTVEFSATTFTALTPATHVLLVSKESNIFAFGRTPVNSEINGQAMDTIAQSTTGRLSLPATHPVALQLDEPFRKTILLQRVTDELCMVIASDQLLVAFTASDLEWLGRLAKLIQMEAE